MHGEHWWTAIFKSCHRFSIGFRSWLWLGHSRTFLSLFLSHSNVALVVCFVSLSCWKVNFCPNFSFHAEGRRFSSRIFLYFVLSSFVSGWPLLFGCLLLWFCMKDFSLQDSISICLYYQSHRIQGVIHIYGMCSISKLSKYPLLMARSRSLQSVLIGSMLSLPSNLSIDCTQQWL